eukprot:TRINITY_DN20848_c0_g1_i1.p1 TRINITY_DN20848_c0_g1~~TRINITY_DN20848_c0_g1_i1.p1  ORF type:complete len:509 (-),score=66.42 TRINITY_DN20848_c0_g1_i1:16-1542(-)
MFWRCKAMPEHTMLPRVCHSKKLKIFMLTVLSGFALICSLGFLRISGQPFKLDQLPSYLDPKLNVVVDSTKPPNHIDENGQSASTSLVTPTNIEDTQLLTSDKNLCKAGNTALKVFLYDLPPEFHFGMLDWKPGKGVWPETSSDIPRYPGGLNLQHSVEYWLTMDLLSSNKPDRREPCAAVRAENSKEADVFFVPFFSSLSYNRHSKVSVEGQKSRNDQLQEKLVQFLMAQETWKRSSGKDHVIVMHHPNSMTIAREQLRSAMYIVADFGRYSPVIGNVAKDIVAPYRHVVPSFVKDISTYESRKTLLFFQGAIFRKDGGYIRQELYSLLKDENGVHFAFGNAQRDGIRSSTIGMRSSKFCLNIAGDTPSSNRLFDAIVSHCVPVIISDEIELPYEDVLDYTEFCVFVRSADALKKGFLINLLKGVKKEEWTRMWEKLNNISHYFEYQYPSQPDDAVQMIWKAIARKLPSVRLSVHKGKRYSRSGHAKQVKSFPTARKSFKGRRQRER